MTRFWGGEDRGDMLQLNLDNYADKNGVIAIPIDRLRSLVQAIEEGAEEPQCSGCERPILPGASTEFVDYLSDHKHTWHAVCARLYELGVEKATDYGEDHE